MLPAPPRTGFGQDLLAEEASVRLCLADDGGKGTSGYIRNLGPGSILKHSEVEVRPMGLRFAEK
jgi:hypothetical protein